MLTDRLPIYQSTFELTKYVYTCSKRFERLARIMVGEKMVRVSLDMLDCILNANSEFSEERITHLNRFKVLVEQLKTLCRFCLEMKITNNKQSAQLALLLGNVGKQLTGWRKSTIDKMANRTSAEIEEEKKMIDMTYDEFVKSMDGLIEKANDVIIRDINT